MNVDLAHRYRNGSASGWGIPRRATPLPPTTHPRGFAGSEYRRVTTEDGTLCLWLGGAIITRHRPSDDEWARFWSVLDSVGAWKWESAYGRSIKDGASWSLELHQQLPRRDLRAGLEWHHVQLGRFVAVGI